MDPEKEDNFDNDSEDAVLDSDEIRKKLKELEKWRLSSDEKAIFRNIEFDNFRESVNFINGVASFCEKTKYYPDLITIKKNKVRVKLTTNALKGLSKKDFVLAREIDLIAGWKVEFQEWISSTKVIVILLILFALTLWWRYFT